MARVIKCHVRRHLSFILLLLIISFHDHACHGRILMRRSSVTLRGVGEDVPLLSEDGSDHHRRHHHHRGTGSGDSSRLIRSEAILEGSLVWRNHRGLVLNFLPKGSNNPPSGPSKGHN
ncbi:hypothetical protein Dimus_006913 [Dionaea muscipula]